MMSILNARKALLATLLLGLVMAGGCGTRQSAGDAMVRTSKPFIGYPGDRVHAVSFPRIKLDRVRSYHFVVRGLPDTVYQYEFILPLPYVSLLGSIKRRGQEPSWGPAVVEFIVARPDGSLVANDTRRLGDTIRPYMWPTDGQWKMSLGQLRGWGPLTDYDLTINVIQPSPGWFDAAELRGWGMTNIHRPPRPATRLTVIPARSFVR